MPVRKKINLEAVTADVERVITADDLIVSVRLDCGHEVTCQARHARWTAAKGTCPECIQKSAPEA